MKTYQIHLLLVIGGILLLELYEIVSNTWTIASFILRVMEYWFCLLIADEITSKQDIDVQMLSIIVINNLRLSYAKILNIKDNKEKEDKNEPSSKPTI